MLVHAPRSYSQTSTLHTSSQIPFVSRAIAQGHSGGGGGRAAEGGGDGEAGGCGAQSPLSNEQAAELQLYAVSHEPSPSQLNGQLQPLAAGELTVGGGGDADTQSPPSKAHSSVLQFHCPQTSQYPSLFHSIGHGQLLSDGDDGG